MRKLYPLMVFSLLLLSGFARADEKKPAPAASPAWNKTMQDLYGTLSKVLTTVTSDKKFADPKAKAELKKNVAKLSGLAHDLDRSSANAPDKDPSVIIYGKLFAEEAKYAERLLRSGHDAYARTLLTGISGYCISCHTRTQSGPSFSSLPLSPSGDLKPFERGSFFAASRQYDRALEEYDRVLSQENAPKLYPIEWSRAVKYSLAIAVRVKRDPTLADRIIDRILSSPTAPFFMKQDASKWRESVAAWKKESKHTAVTEDGLRSEAVRLWASAHEFQRYPEDSGADVIYLRASAAIHDLLQNHPTGRHSAEGYLLAGMVYEVLRPFNLGELHEIYYEACIRKHPHTTAAELCYGRFEAAAYAGYTGSSGTHLPDELKEKLKELEGISRINPVQPAALH